MQITKETIFNADSAPNCEIYHQFLHAVNSAARTSGLTRQGIADRMNRALKVDETIITEAKLNKYLSPATEIYLPAHMVPALLWALRSIEPINVLLEPLMYSAFDQRAQLLQKHAEMEMQKQQIEKSQQEILNSITLPNDQ
ncbi:hypothetical protein HG263_06785 [Pseudoalteromonas sp. JBTF-M23]|uniref:Uncharacterized protein n=1 Tax=Pseudoalteromonas caenipelagi TaxID=2726988 RepID=A0A849VBM2_9GAMM|nr:hypothetical protein [Pseudoalteromonas caenipelagi]NOU50248.1 hypothetical protein [Pseudoalteromonas caenipelagi]